MARSPVQGSDVMRKPETKLGLVLFSDDVRRIQGKYSESASPQLGDVLFKIVFVL